MNLDSTTQTLVNYNYRDAIFPIYDIAGSKAINAPQNSANSYVGAMDYASIIQKTFAVKERMENKYYSMLAYIGNPIANGVDLKFTNQIPTNSDLEHPVRSYNTPKTYAQNNFFSLYNTMQHHTIYGGKAVLYDRSYPTDIMMCNMK